MIEIEPTGDFVHGTVTKHFQIRVLAWLRLRGSCRGPIEDPATLHKDLQKIPSLAQAHALDSSGLRTALPGQDGNPVDRAVHGRIARSVEVLDEEVVFLCDLPELVLGKALELRDEFRFEEGAKSRIAHGGSRIDTGRLGGSVSPQTARLAANDAAEGQKLLALYKRRHPETRNRMLWLMADSDDTRRWNAQLLCRLKYEQGTAPSYLYFFNWQSPVHNNRMGSYHTLDITFVFYNMDIGASMTGSRQSRYELGHVMSAAWAAFARTGNPNHADMPNWPSFEPNSLPTMVFGEKVAVVNDPNKEERLALAELRKKRPS